MLLELAEVLACPSCGPPQVLVAVVGSSEGRCVTEGFLGCPACESRFSIRAGVADLRRDPGSEDTMAGPSRAPTTGEEEAVAPAGGAMLLAALLAESSGPGPILLGPGVSGAAEELASLVADRDIVALLAHADRIPRRASPGRVTRLITDREGRLPLLPGRVPAAAFAGGMSEGLAHEVCRILGSGGRLVVLRPAGGDQALVQSAGLSVQASDPRAILATRPASRPA